MPWDNPVFSKAQEELLVAYQARLNGGEPLSKIIEKREFWSRDFKVTYDTLDPRPDSEVLIQVCLDIEKELPHPLTILELGVGTGCLLITLLLEMQGVGHAVGVDISNKALVVARENAETHGIQNCVWVNSDWFSAIPREEFSLIITNPPYIGQDEEIEDTVRKFDPHLALFSENSGLKSYQTIAKDAKLFLKDGGALVCEIGHLQRESVVEIFTSSGFRLKQVLKDLAGKDRCIVFSK